MMQSCVKDVREVTLVEILNAREQRAALQKKLLDQYRVPLISFTMNIAGPVKRTPLIERAFYCGLTELRSRLAHCEILFEQVSCEPCGCEAMLAVNADAELLKEIGVEIEEASPLGRLLDVDVIARDGSKLERARERGCIVCGKHGRTCAAGRIHPVEALFAVTAQIMTEHFARTDAERVGKLATRSLILEVETTPKPGLVDLRNNGSHRDMDVDTFRASAHALEPYFVECVKLGIKHKTSTPDEAFLALREAGLLAEKAMYGVTNGINTHKGAIYSMGVLLGAIGRLWTPELPIVDTELILAESALLVRGSARADLEAANGATAGEKLFLQCGLKGIRGEVASGFASVARHSLPTLESALAAGAALNDASVRALLALIAAIDDTNLYHRGGAEGAHFAREYAARLLAQGADREAVERMDDAFIQRNLSPGGAADLLAVTCFLHLLKSEK